MEHCSYIKTLMDQYLYIETLMEHGNENVKALYPSDEAYWLRHIGSRHWLIIAEGGEVFTPIESEKLIDEYEKISNPFLRIKGFAATSYYKSEPYYS